MSQVDLMLPDPVREVLAQLRLRIRGYVVLEGIALVLLTLTVAFWCGFALDYLPVLMGASEMPRGARAMLLAVVLALAAFVLYWFIGRRLAYALRDRSLALVIERRFPQFRDSLVTAVEAGIAGTRTAEDADLEALRNTGPHTSAMLSSTVADATQQLGDVKLAHVFRYAPVLSKLGGATLGLLSLVLFGLFAGDTLAVAVSRLVLLDDRPWPRHAHIELVGFTQGEKKVARGRDLVLRVRADAERPVPAPELCTILYRTSEGAQGRVNMSRDGEPRDGFQYYVFNGKPFKGILNDIAFDVIGYDHRLRDQRVRVVASPVVTRVELNCELPRYTGLVPLQTDWTPGLQLPLGSRIGLRVVTNKDVLQVTRRDLDTGETEVWDNPERSGKELAFTIEELTGRFATAIELLDADGIESAEAFLLTIGAMEDLVPVVDVGLRGIGTSITAQARLPFEGEIRDDYEVAERWFQLEQGDEQRRFPLPEDGGAELHAALDLREEAAQENPNPLRLAPQDRLILSVRASDYFDLHGAHHEGATDPISLTVVRPDELLAILDGRELGLRRRFEQIRTETLQSRDSLARLRASFSESSSSEVDMENAAEMRLRWASWAMQKTAQTTLEVRGVALAFEDVLEELVNNRVDTPERKLRLETQIVAPLHQIADAQLPLLAEALDALQRALSSQADGTEPMAAKTLIRADEVVVAMDAVLEKMLELEDYTELVNVIRQILEEQDALLKETEKVRDDSVLDFLD